MGPAKLVAGLSSLGGSTPCIRRGQFQAFGCEQPYLESEVRGGSILQLASVPKVAAPRPLHASRELSCAYIQYNYIGLCWSSVRAAFNVPLQFFSSLLLLPQVTRRVFAKTQFLPPADFAFREGYDV